MRGSLLNKSSFVSVDVEKAWCRKPCERMVRVQQNCNAQVSTITTYLYPVGRFEENTGRMAAMSEVLLLTNSIGLNQVESKSHKVNTAGSGNVSGTYRPRNLYKQQWGKSPHNISVYIKTHCPRL
jgi:hypothetical protein